MKQHVLRLKDHLQVTLLSKQQLLHLTLLRVKLILALMNLQLLVMDSIHLTQLFIRKGPVL